MTRRQPARLAGHGPNECICRWGDNAAARCPAHARRSLAGLGTVEAALCAEGRPMRTGVGNCAMREVGGDARGLAGLGDLVFVVT